MNKIKYFLYSKFFKMKTLIQLLTLGLCLFTFSTVAAQSLQAQGEKDPSCGTDELMHKMYRENPGLREQVRKIREDIKKQEEKQRSSQDTNLKDGACDPIHRTIPMVFHVIHQGGDEKITKTQIDAAIQDLFNDFNSSNADRLQPGDPFYEDQACVSLDFNLATQDPEGNATNGITYTESIYTNGGDSFDAQMKDLIHWPEEDYLNVYVVKYMTDKSAWAFYPEQTESGSGDGVTIRYNYLGTTEGASPSSAIHSDPKFYPQGYHNRTHILAHEVGHWLGLQHAWGDEGENGSPFTTAGETINCDYDDGINDTPYCIGTSAIVSPQNATCANLSDSSCSGTGYSGGYNYGNSSCGANLVNIFNMMDYGIEVMFTEGQKTRMLSYLDPVNGPKIAGRDVIGTTGNAYVPDGFTTLVMDGYYFQESPENDGGIYNSIIIELSNGSFNFIDNGNGPKYINPSWVSTNNLPAGLTLYVYEVQNAPNKARLAISGKANNHDNIDDVSDVEVTFDFANVFSGTGNLHNRDLTTNTVTLKGLKVDFEEFEPVYTRFAVNGTKEYVCVENEDQYEGFFAIDFGQLALHKKGGKYHLLTESSINVEVASNTQNADGTNNATYYSVGTNIHQIPSSQFKPVTRAYDDTGAIILNDITSDQYITFRINTDGTSGSRILYGWFRVGMDGAKYCVLDAVYNTASSGFPLQTGENPIICNSAPNGNTILPANLSIGGIPVSNGMTLQSANYTTYNFSVGTSYASTYNHSNWGVWIDVNNDGYFDYDEAYFSIYYFPVTTTISGEGTAYYDVFGDYRVLDGIDLSNIPDGQYTMRIIFSPYAYNSHSDATYFFDPCQPYESGSTQDFTVNIGTGNSICFEDNTQDHNISYTLLSNNSGVIVQSLPSQYYTNHTATWLLIDVDLNAVSQIITQSSASEPVTFTGLAAGTYRINVQVSNNTDSNCYIELTSASFESSGPPSCSGCGCSRLSTLERTVLQSLSTMINKDLDNNFVNAQKAFIKHEKEIVDLFESNKKVNRLAKEMKSTGFELFTQSMVYGKDVVVEKEHYILINELLDALMEEARSKNLKNSIIEIQKYLPIIEGKEIRQGIKDFDKANKQTVSKNKLDLMTTEARILTNNSNNTSLIFQSECLKGVLNLTLYNTNGQKIADILNSKKIDNGRLKFDFDTYGLTSGVYLVKVHYNSQDCEHQEAIKFSIFN